MGLGLDKAPWAFQKEKVNALLELCPVPSSCPRCWQGAAPWVVCQHAELRPTHSCSLPGPPSFPLWLSPETLLPALLRCDFSLAGPKSLRPRLRALGQEERGWILKPIELLINEYQNPEAAGIPGCRRCQPHQKVFMHKRFLRTSARGGLDTAGHAAACLCRSHAEKGESDKTEQSS